MTRPEVYLWRAPGKPVAVEISLEVVDRILQDVLRGFGAVPKRGAEVGGILTGRSSRQDGLNVQIEDFELVPIEYRRGPSYLLSDADRKAFAETFGRLRNGTNGTYPVGFFRSQTRDGSGLAQEDLELLGEFFPGPDRIALLIRPYASKVSTAGFHFREGNRFAEGASLLEFPFRRRELSGDVEPARRPLGSGRNEPHPANRVQASDLDSRMPGAGDATAMIPIARADLAVQKRERPIPPPPPRVLPDAETVDGKGRTGWVWLPLSFIFLLLGVLLGFQSAVTLRPQSTTVADPFSLSLSVSKDGDNLNVRWDRQAPAIRAAQRGVLVIEDSTYNKTVELDSSQLQTGSVVYRHSSGDVKFRLELFIHPRNSLFEKLEWKQ